MPLRKRLDQDTHEVGQVRRYDEPGERNLTTQRLAELRDAKVPDEHQFAGVASAQRCDLTDKVRPPGRWRAARHRGCLEFLTLNGYGTLDGRLDALRRDLEARIRPLVPDLSDEEFHALIERMAQLQYKYEARRAEDFFDRSARDEASENDAKSEI